MPNLADTIATQFPAKESLVKRAAQLTISASVDPKKYIRSDSFHAVQIPIRRIPTIFVPGAKEDGDIVIDVNASKLGKTKHGDFYPRFVVLSGTKKFKAAKHSTNRELMCSAWVGVSALKKLKIAPHKVESTRPNTMSADGLTGYGAMLLFDKPNSGPVQGAFVGPNIGVIADMTNYGAPGSEANNPQLKLMLNVEEALRMYQMAIANGTHKPIVPISSKVTSPSLINAAREAEIAASDVGANISIGDFLQWQDRMMRVRASSRLKYEGDKPLTEFDHAYVGDASDVSTWHLPMFDSHSVRASYRALSELPKRWQPEALVKLQAAAVEHGVVLKAEKGGVRVGSGRIKADGKNPHKFKISTKVKSKCAVCGNKAGHPLHNVK